MKCKYCEKPLATQADYDTTPEGKGQHLCWSDWSRHCTVSAEEALDIARARVAQAKEVLEQAACGGVGPEGMTLDEMRSVWADGRAAEDDSYYDTCQHAWRLLEGSKGGGVG